MMSPTVDYTLLTTAEGDPRWRVAVTKTDLADSFDLPQNDVLIARPRMPVKIEVQPAGDNQFRVRVTEGKSETRHQVTVTPEDYQRLTGGKVDAADFVRRSFEFLLENEPKESILQKFDLTVISRYFPEYETEIARRLNERG